MGGTHTQVLVNAVWKAVLGTWHSNLTGQVNGIGRKVGHFFGYGLVSLIFRNAWYKSAQALSWVARIWLTPFAAFFAIMNPIANTPIFLGLTEGFIGIHPFASC